MAKADLTFQAREGYEAGDEQPNPFYASSPAGMAWQVGRWLKSSGRSEPRNVSSSRGNRMHANDMLVEVGDGSTVTRIN